MSRRARMVGAGLLAAVVAVVGLVVVGGSDGYRVRVALDDASGIRKGVEVRAGGVPIGIVEDMDLDDRDTPIAELRIDDEHAPIGRGATVSVAALNLLGQKTLSIQPGDRGRPLASGELLPRGSVRIASELQDVLNVLDPRTRTRLAVLANEAAVALGGPQDVRLLLGELPRTIEQGTRLLDGLVRDNTTLGRLVADSDRFVTAAARRRTDVTRAVRSVGQAAEVLAQRRAALSETIEAAPGALRSARGFLVRLDQAAAPLGPAARQLRAAAPPLDGTLGEVDRFRDAAEPVLREAIDAGPAVSKLARRATPVLRAAAPTARALRTFGHELAPVSDVLDGSIENLLATVENWSRAVQERDGISHYFRGEAALTPDVLLGLMRRLDGANRGAGRQRRERPARAPKRPVDQGPPTTTPEAPKALKLPQLKLPKVKLPDLDELPKVKLPKLDLSELLPSSPDQSADGDAVTDILDFLLR